MKCSSVKTFLKNLSHNQVVLYLVALCALFNLVGYTMKNNLAAIALFLGIGFSSTYFTKNMILVLLAAIIGTNLLIRLGLFKSLGIREGLTNSNDEDNKDTSDDESEKPKPKPKPPVKHTNSSMQMLEEENENHINGDKEKKILVSADEKSAAGSDKPKVNSQAALKSSPADLNDDKEELTGMGAKVDYAGTVEKAFENLENILGSDGMKKMSADTSRLADKQKNLVSAMHNMQPLMDNAQKMLKSLERGPFAGFLKGNTENK